MGVKIREKPEGSGVFWIFINHHGKRKSKRVGSEAAAVEVARKIEAKLTLGELAIEKINAKASSFSECARIWLSIPHDWKESTREGYQDHLKNHILPCFGKMPINEISRKGLKAFFDKKYSEDLSVQTLKLIRAPINGVFTYAIDAELIETNPFRELSLKYKKKKFEINPLTEPETILLLDQARAFMGGTYYPAFLTALRTVVRIGELQTLK
jgi:integrase